MKLLLIEADREGLVVPVNPADAAGSAWAELFTSSPNAANANSSTPKQPSERPRMLWRASVKQQRAPLVTKRFNSKICLDTGVMSLVAYYPRTEVWCGCRDGTIRLCDYQRRGKNVAATLVGHTSRVSALLYIPHTQQIWSAGDDARVVVWNPEKRVVVRTLLGHRTCVRSIVYIPTTNEVWSGDTEGVIRVWNAVCIRFYHRGDLF